MRSLPATSHATRPCRVLWKNLLKRKKSEGTLPLCLSEAQTLFVLGASGKPEVVESGAVAPQLPLSSLSSPVTEFTSLIIGGDRKVVEIECCHRINVSISL